MKRWLCFRLLAVLCVWPVAVFARQAVSGTVYHDANLSSRSAYVQEIDDGDVLLPNIQVDLLDGVNEISTYTDEAGRFEFADVLPMDYVLDLHLGDHDCTSNNRARRLPDAIRAGIIHLISLGDSIGVYNEPGVDPYPVRLAARLSQFAEVDLHNIHVGGSTSWQWLPGADTGYFDDRLLPVIDDADVVTVTITGNDLAPYVEGMSPPYDVWQIIQNFFAEPEYLLQILPRLEQLLQAIHDVNETCDVVFIMYPNFGNSTYMINDIGEALQPLVAELFPYVLGTERFVAGDVDGVLITDTLSALGDLWLDDYLIDEVHPTALGSQTYADEVFKVLGGVLAEDQAAATQLWGFNAPDLVPVVDDDTADDDTADDDTSDDDAVDDDTTDDDTSDDDLVDDDTLDDDAADDDAIDDDTADDDASDDDAVDDDADDDEIDDDSDDDAGDDDTADDDDDNDDSGCGD